VTRASSPHVTSCHSPAQVEEAAKLLFNEIKVGARMLGLMLHVQGSPLVIDQDRQKEPIIPTTTREDSPTPNPVPSSTAAAAAAIAATSGRPQLDDQPLPPPSLGGVQPVPGAAATSVTYTEGGEKTVPLEVIKRYFHWRLKVRAPLLRACIRAKCPCADSSCPLRILSTTQQSLAVRIRVLSLAWPLRVGVR
jgi:hypothetical protein